MITKGLQRLNSKNVLNTVIDRNFASKTRKCDVLILGYGIAGASVSYQLAKLKNLKVIVLEKEKNIGYHATGKSYGIFSEINAPTKEIKLLTTASRPFYESPDIQCVDLDVKDKQILTKTGLLGISSTKNYPYIHQQFHSKMELNDLQILSQNDAINMIPFLNKTEIAETAIYEPNAATFDALLAYEYFLIGSNKLGVDCYTNQNILEIRKDENNAIWEVLSLNSKTNNIDRFESAVIINCCGSSSDDIAQIAGVQKCNIITNKTSVVLFTFDNNIKKDINLPFLGWMSPNVNEIFYSYFTEDVGIFMTNMDATNNEMNETELCIDKIKTFTSLKVKKTMIKPGGIKCYVGNDRNIIIGPDMNDKSFIWCTALGGYGIQTAPAYSIITACLATNDDLPSNIVDLGIDVKQLLPSRLHYKYF